VSSTVSALPGQETLLECWARLAQMSPGARLMRSSETAAAVFPAWIPLNNAIMLNADDGAAAAAATELRGVYADAGVDAWALWLPSRAIDLDVGDDVREVDGMERDTTTLVMQAEVPRGLPRHDGVVRTSLATLMQVASDIPVPTADLGRPEAAPGLAMWVMIQDDLAVACAFSFLHERDCGIYAVGTLPQWRRRGLARVLVEHVLADAERRGARTATLQSTRIGRHLYQSLGFEPAGRYEEWVPRAPESGRSSH
jgi:ribosomal protein S18 acetylase RimI-like enzyme